MCKNIPAIKPVPFTSPLRFCINKPTDHQPLDMRYLVRIMDHIPDYLNTYENNRDIKNFIKNFIENTQRNVRAATSEAISYNSSICAYNSPLLVDTQHLNTPVNFSPKDLTLHTVSETPEDGNNYSVKAIALPAVQPSENNKDSYPLNCDSIYSIYYERPLEACAHNDIMFPKDNNTDITNEKPVLFNEKYYLENSNISDNIEQYSDYMNSDSDDFQVDYTETLNLPNGTLLVLKAEATSDEVTFYTKIQNDIEWRTDEITENMTDGMTIEFTLEIEDFLR